MTSSSPTFASSAARDRLGEIASIGAGHAAGALAGMLGGTFCMGVPRIVVGSRDAVDPEVCGVLFGLEGPLPGSVAWLLPPEAVEQLLARVAGGAGAATAAGSSALRELGNIVVSHLASAIGEVLSAVVLPTPPELAERRAGDALARLPGADGLRIEVDVYERAGGIRTVLVLIPSNAALPAAG